MRSIATTTPVTPDALATNWSVEVLRSVWEQQRWRVEERIAVIERAAAALAEGNLDARLRHEAERAAHMLAGSVGMFGFTQASVAARRLEWEFAHLQPASDLLLPSLLSSIRSDVQGGPDDGQAPAG